MRTVFGASKSDGRGPLINQPSILPRAHMAGAIDAAWKGKVLDRSTAPLQPAQEAGTDISCQLELHWPAGLLLDHRRAVSHLRTRDKIADLDLHEVAAAQFAVDRQIKQRPIPKAPFAIKKEADRPNLLLCQRALRSNGLSDIPRRPPLNDRIILRVTHRISPRPTWAGGETKQGGISSAVS